MRGVQGHQWQGRRCANPRQRNQELPSKMRSQIHNHASIGRTTEVLEELICRKCPWANKKQSKPPSSAKAGRAVRVEAHVAQKVPGRRHALRAPCFCPNYPQKHPLTDFAPCPIMLADDANRTASPGRQCRPPRRRAKCRGLSCLNTISNPNPRPATVVGFLLPAPAGPSQHEHQN